MLKTLQTSYQHHSGFTRHLKVILVAGLVWLSSALGMLQPLNDFFYDHFATLHLHPPAPGSGILLLEVEDEVLEGGSDVYRDIIQRFSDLGARHILFTFTPDFIDAEFLGGLPDSPPISWGRRLFVDRYDPEVRALEELPDVDGPLAIEAFRVYRPPFR